MIFRTLVGVAILVLLNPFDLGAQARKVRVAMPGYTIAGISFLTAKLNGYCLACASFSRRSATAPTPSASLSTNFKPSTPFASSKARHEDGCRRKEP